MTSTVTCMREQTSGLYLEFTDAYLDTVKENGQADVIEIVTICQGLYLRVAMNFGGRPAFRQLETISPNQSELYIFYDEVHQGWYCSKFVWEPSDADVRALRKNERFDMDDR